MVGVFLLFYALPVEWQRFQTAAFEALALARWYAQEHVILCLLPAFFIAGGIAVFVSQGSVMKYLGPTANKACAYGVASCSGTILAVCSCTILPLFAGIYRMGAGLGRPRPFSMPVRPSTSWQSSSRPAFSARSSAWPGPWARRLQRGHRLDHASRLRPGGEGQGAQGRGHARTGADSPLVAERPVLRHDDRRSGLCQLGHARRTIRVLVPGLSGQMAPDLAVCRPARLHPGQVVRADLVEARPGGLPALALALAFPAHPTLAFAAGVVGLSVITSTRKGEPGEWFEQSWGFAKQILPLLLFGVLIAGLLLGRPGEEGLIPSAWVSTAVGGNSLLSNFVASFAGAFMYFATLTEVPILQGLIGSGMGKGPALALLLAGPALSLPNMLVIRSIIGTRKTLVFVSLVIFMATVSGVIYGTYFP
jgi:uncharacterized protein